MSTTNSVISSAVAQPYGKIHVTVFMGKETETKKEQNVGFRVVEKVTKTITISLSEKAYDFIVSCDSDTAGLGSWTAPNNITFMAGDVANEFRVATKTFFLSKSSFRGKQADVLQLSSFSGQAFVKDYVEEIATALKELAAAVLVAHPKADIFDGLETF